MSQRPHHRRSAHRSRSRSPAPCSLTTATALRAALIAQLEREGALHDPAVRTAMLAVPRHLFLPNEPLERAYANDAIATKFADGVSISSASQPAIVALMLEQLALAPGMNVLEIGAGTGYNAALMRTLVGPGGQVTTVDIDADITDAAREHLAAIGITRCCSHHRRTARSGMRRTRRTTGSSSPSMPGTSRPRGRRN